MEKAAYDKVYSKVYRAEHLPNRRARIKEKLATDVRFKLSAIVRGRFRTAFKRKYKAGSAIRDLGCTVGEFFIHLEAQFYPHPVTGEEMTWENQGFYGWHIDHVIPFASIDVTDREQLLTVLHYTNQQPLWAIDNWKKGDKLNWRR